MESLLTRKRFNTLLISELIIPSGGKIAFYQKANFFWGVEAIGSRLPKFFCPQNVLVSTYSDFRLSTGGRRQNLKLSEVISEAR